MVKISTQYHPPWASISKRWSITGKEVRLSMWVTVTRSHHIRTSHNITYHGQNFIDITTKVLNMQSKDSCTNLHWKFTGLCDSNGLQLFHFSQTSNLAIMFIRIIDLTMKHFLNFLIYWLYLLLQLQVKHMGCRRSEVTEILLEKLFWVDRRTSVGRRQCW